MVRDVAVGSLVFSVAALVTASLIPDTWVHNKAAEFLRTVAEDHAREVANRTTLGCPEGYVLVWPHRSNAVCLPGLPPTQVRARDCRPSQCRD